MWIRMCQPRFDNSRQKRFNPFPYSITAHNQIRIHARGLDVARMPHPRTLPIVCSDEVGITVGTSALHIAQQASQGPFVGI
jgi:hypothetical protein